MTTESEIWKMELLFWEGGAECARKMTANGAVVVYPDPPEIVFGVPLMRDHAMAQRWRNVEMTEKFFLQRENVAVVAYKVSASREGVEVFGALCSSTYLLADKKWERLCHQQMPETEPLEN